MTFLLDGPLMTAHERKRQVTKAMAELLWAYPDVVCREDAVRVLRSAGYSMFDVDLCVDNARALAFQPIVAREMSAS